MDINTTEFNGLIKKIKTKRVISLVAFVACLIGIWFFIEEVMLVVLFVIGAFASLLAYLIIGTPTYNALYNDCDARKHLVLLNGIEKGKGTYPLLVTAYFYIGDFDTSIHYAKRVYQNKSVNSKLTALYWIALNQFFLGKTEEFKQTAFDFQAKTKSAKLSERQRKGILQCHAVINLLLSITYKDDKKIKDFLEKLNLDDNTQIAKAFENYLKGIAYYELSDKMKCAHNFMSVCDIASKTILGTLAKRYLDKLNGENDTGGENL